MSQQECLVSDWRTVGFEDGVRGATADSIGRYRKTCAKHGVAPDFEAYQAGRAEGLRSFCQPGNGFDLGARGGSYRGICPADLEPEFVASFQDGRVLYELESGVRSADQMIASRNRELDDLAKALRDTEATLIADGTSAEERVLLVLDIKALSERMGAVENEILDLERDRAVRAQELAQYRQTLAGGY
jgi:hypothetical protein